MSAKSDIRKEIIDLLSILSTTVLVQRGDEWLDKRAAFGATDGIRISAALANEAIELGLATVVDSFPQDTWFSWLCLTDTGKTLISEGKDHE